MQERMEGNYVVKLKRYFLAISNASLGTFWINFSATPSGFQVVELAWSMSLACRKKHPFLIAPTPGPQDRTEKAGEKDTSQKAKEQEAEEDGLEEEVADEKELEEQELEE